MPVRPATDFPTGWMNTDAQNPPTGHSSHRLDKNTLSYAPQTPKSSSQWDNQDARKPTSSHSRPRPETKAPSIRTEKPVTSQRPENRFLFWRTRTWQASPSTPRKPFSRSPSALPNYAKPPADTHRNHELSTTGNQTFRGQPPQDSVKS